MLFGIVTVRRDFPNLGPVFTLLTVWGSKQLSEKELRTRCSFLLATAGIVRYGDLVKITREDVAFQGSVEGECAVIRIVAPKEFRLRNPETYFRVVYLPKLAGPWCPVAALKAYLAVTVDVVNDAPLFVSVLAPPKVGRVQKARSVVEAITLCKAVENLLLRPAGLDKNLTPHSFKSFVVSKAFAAGVNLVDIMAHAHAFSVSVLREHYIRSVEPAATLVFPDLRDVKSTTAVGDNIRIARSFITAVFTEGNGR